MRITRNMVNKILNDPYMEIDMIYRHFNGNVPMVMIEPNRNHFGLNDSAEEELQQESHKITLKYNTILTVLYIIGYIITALIYKNCLGVIGFWGVCVYPLFTYGWAAPVFFSIIGGNGIERLCNRKKQQTALYKRYKQYTDQLKAYTYWQKVKSLDYWMNLDGHQFEEAVARVFRKQGYQAQVSKQGGDGGIDIVLIMNDHRIAVQCKAHKKQIGPSVARDLYGTMLHFGYTEGMIVSRSGFTLGVEDFVRGKNIKLVNMHDLLKMQTNSD